MRERPQARATGSIVVTPPLPSPCSCHGRPGRRRQRPRVMVGGALIVWWSAVGLLMSCSAPPSHARRHPRPAPHHLQGSHWPGSASSCGDGVTPAAFALPQLSTAAACSSSRRQNTCNDLGGVGRICGGKSTPSHVNCGMNSICDRATMGTPGGRNGGGGRLLPSALLYRAALHWLSSNRIAGSPVMASLQSTHEETAVDSAGLKSSSTTPAAATTSQQQQAQHTTREPAAGTHTTLAGSSSHFFDANGSEKKEKEHETSASVSLEDTLDVISTKTKTPNGGHCHTPESRGKISAANKGKTPWNKGGNHSEETRRKIAEGAREAARRRKLAMATAMVRRFGVRVI